MTPLKYASKCSKKYNIINIKYEKYLFTNIDSCHGHHYFKWHF